MANILGHIANTLTVNQTSGPNSNQRETKAYISNTFSSTKSNKLNNFCTNPMQFDIDIVKINFVMTYLTKVIQNN